MSDLEKLADEYDHRENWATIAWEDSKAKAEQIAADQLKNGVQLPGFKLRVRVIDTLFGGDQQRKWLVQTYYEPLHYDSEVWEKDEKNTRK